MIPLFGEATDIAGTVNRGKYNCFLSSSTQNATDYVPAIADGLNSLNITISYEWWKAHIRYVERAGELPLSQAKIAESCIRQNLINGLNICDFYLYLYPGGNGSHFEMGYALALKKPVIMYAPARGMMTIHNEFFSGADGVLVLEGDITLLNREMKIIRKYIDSKRPQDPRRADDYLNFRG